MNSYEALIKTLHQKLRFRLSTADALLQHQIHLPQEKVYSPPSTKNTRHPWDNWQDCTFCGDIRLSSLRMLYQMLWLVFVPSTISCHTFTHLICVTEWPSTIKRMGAFCCHFFPLKCKKLFLACGYFPKKSNNYLYHYHSALCLYTNYLLHYFSIFIPFFNSMYFSR